MLYLECLAFKTVCGSSITTAMRRGSIPEMSVRYRSSRPRSLGQIFFTFHFPRLNKIALAPAIAASAMTMAQKAPLERKFIRMASQ